MKILWISATIFTEDHEKQSGVWQKSLAMKLSKLPDIELYNISYHKAESYVSEYQIAGIKQWGIKRQGKNKKGYPPKMVRNLFKELVLKINPDIVHVWGSENPFKFLPFDNSIPGIKVLSMQGVLGSIAENLFNGLTNRDLISTIGIREIIKRESLFSERISFFEEAQTEEKIIANCDHIITQSEWTESQIKNINPQAKTYRIHRVLRSEIINSIKWTSFEHNKPVLYSAAIGFTIKGLHVLIKALALVKTDYPNIELRLAGLTGRTDFLGEGYLRYILRLIKKYNLKNNVKWLGALNANQISENLQQASVFINPSFIESYSLVVAEAMTIGTPSVISFAGAMPELAENNKEALFFTPGDYKQCASMIIKLLNNNDLSNSISINAQKRAEFRNSIIDIATDQINVYREILSVEHSII